jgi:DNA anti-recombination protein RmuC
MKLQELAAISPSKQAAKVFESYFGGRINIDTITSTQARNLLTRVRKLVSEHRRTPEFHRSEQNPSYLKLVMMEQVLSARVKEDGGATVGMAQPSGGTAAKTDPAAQGTQAMQAVNIQQKKKQDQDQLKQIDQQIQSLQQQKSQIQQQMNNPTMMAETRRQRRLREASEIQQAQVVLAAQDMVDQVQKMSEQISSMQFKDLPALVDQIKNEVGPNEAGQFNGDASAALAGLLQNLQGAKQQLESALGVVTGQAPQIPGEETGAEMTPPAEEVPAELPPPEEGDIDAEMDANLGTPKAALGRGRR